MKALTVKQSIWINSDHQLISITPWYSALLVTCRKRVDAALGALIMPQSRLLGRWVMSSFLRAMTAISVPRFFHYAGLRAARAEKNKVPFD